MSDLQLLGISITLDELLGSAKSRIDAANFGENDSKWKTIRDAYAINAPYIFRAAQRDRVGKIDPYWLPWHKIFTPIEDMAWQAIRGLGVPLYPQIPVNRYFVDFGNPVLKIGLEIDGAQWHQDIEKDRKRDDELFASEGWHIYRCTGRESFAMVDAPEFSEEPDHSFPQREKLTSTVEGILQAIGNVYGIWKCSDEVLDLSYRTLHEHRLGRFEIGRGTDIRAC